MKKSNDSALLAETLKDIFNTKKEATCLVFLDDSFDGDQAIFLPYKKQVSIIINRIDYAEHLNQHGIRAYFSDFEIPLDLPHPSHIIYRISKEKSVVNHIINNSSNILEKSLSDIHRKTDLRLYLIGRKEDGLKSISDKCSNELGFRGKPKKHNTYYVSKLTKEKIARTALDDSNYTALRKITDLSIFGKNYALHSKPGVYGWNKVDSGTTFLIETLETQHIAKYLRTKQQDEKTRALDLGCGSGHLSLALHALDISNITSTDNNAAAIAACQYTCSTNKIEATVLASNCANNIHKQFDLILCNPPFHKGFDTSTDLTERFITACKRLLSKHGRAFFVFNTFVGVEKILPKYHLQGEEKANNKQFKVLEIRHQENQR